VDQAAEGLHHRAGGEVAGDGRDRRHPEQQHEDRGHQRAAAHPGQADDDADTEAGERHHGVHAASLLFRLT